MLIHPCNGWTLSSVQRLEEISRKPKILDNLQDSFHRWVPRLQRRCQASQHIITQSKPTPPRHYITSVEPDQKRSLQRWRNDKRPSLKEQLSHVPSNRTHEWVCRTQAAHERLATTSIQTRQLKWSQQEGSFIPSRILLLLLVPRSNRIQSTHQRNLPHPKEWPHKNCNDRC